MSDNLLVEDPNDTNEKQLPDNVILVGPDHLNTLLGRSLQWKGGGRGVGGVGGASSHSGAGAAQRLGLSALRLLRKCL